VAYWRIVFLIPSVYEGLTKTLGKKWKEGRDWMMLCLDVLNLKLNVTKKLPV
jgi:hypothetical protein